MVVGVTEVGVDGVETVHSEVLTRSGDETTNPNPNPSLTTDLARSHTDPHRFTRQSNFKFRDLRPMNLIPVLRILVLFETFLSK